MRLGLGEKFDLRDLGGIVWYCDILAYEFPILSLYHVDNRHLYLSLCVTRKKSSATWLLIDVPEKKLRDFFDQSVSLLSLLNQSKLLLYFQQTRTGRRNVRRIDFSDIPEKLLPADDSFYDEDFATDEAVAIGREKTAGYSIEINGDWYLEDLANFPSLYRQIYAFNHGISNFDDELIGKRVMRSINSQPYRGGYSIVNMLAGMGESIPPTSRVRIEGISKNSPGYIKLRVDQKVAQSVEDVLNILNDGQRRGSLKRMYKESNKFLDSHHLRSIDLEDFNFEKFPDHDDLLAELDFYISRIASGLGFERQILALKAAVEPLALLKSLLAYTKRIFRLQDFVDEGLITKFGGTLGME